MAWSLFKWMGNKESSEKDEGNPSSHVDSHRASGQLNESGLDELESMHQGHVPEASTSLDEALQPQSPSASKTAAGSASRSVSKASSSKFDAFESPGRSRKHLRSPSVEMLPSPAEMLNKRAKLGHSPGLVVRNSRIRASPAAHPEASVKRPVHTETIEINTTDSSSSSDEEARVQALPSKRMPELSNARRVVPALSSPSIASSGGLGDRSQPGRARQSTVEVVIPARTIARRSWAGPQASSSTVKFTPVAKQWSDKPYASAEASSSRLVSLPSKRHTPSPSRVRPLERTASVSEGQSAVTVMSKMAERSLTAVPVGAGYPSPPVSNAAPPSSSARNARYETATTEVARQPASGRIVSPELAPTPSSGKKRKPSSSVQRHVEPSVQGSSMQGSSLEYRGVENEQMLLDDASKRLDKGKQRAVSQAEQDGADNEVNSAIPAPARPAAQTVSTSARPVASAAAVSQSSIVHKLAAALAPSAQLVNMAIPRDYWATSLSQLKDDPAGEGKPSYPYYILARAAILGRPSGAVTIDMILADVLARYPGLREGRSEASLKSSITSAIGGRECFNSIRASGRAYYSVDPQIDPMMKRVARPRKSDAVEGDSIGASAGMAAGSSATTTIAPPPLIQRPTHDMRQRFLSDLLVNPPRLRNLEPAEHFLFATSLDQLPEGSPQAGPSINKAGPPQMKNTGTLAEQALAKLPCPLFVAARAAILGSPHRRLRLDAIAKALLDKFPMLSENGKLNAITRVLSKTLNLHKCFYKTTHSGFVSQPLVQWMVDLEVDPRSVRIEPTNQMTKKEAQQYRERQGAVLARLANPEQTPLDILEQELGAHVAYFVKTDERLAKRRIPLTLSSLGYWQPLPEPPPPTPSPPPPTLPARVPSPELEAPTPKPKPKLVPKHGRMSSGPARAAARPPSPEVPIPAPSPVRLKARPSAPASTARLAGPPAAHVRPASSGPLPAGSSGSASRPRAKPRIAIEKQLTQKHVTDPASRPNAGLAAPSASSKIRKSGSSSPGSLDYEHPSAASSSHRPSSVERATQRVNGKQEQLQRVAAMANKPSTVIVIDDDSSEGGLDGRTSGTVSQPTLNPAAGTSTTADSVPAGPSGQSAVPASPRAAYVCGHLDQKSGAMCEERFTSAADRVRHLRYEHGKIEDKYLLSRPQAVPKAPLVDRSKPKAKAKLKPKPGSAAVRKSGDPSTPTGQVSQEMKRHIVAGQGRRIGMPQQARKNAGPPVPKKVLAPKSMRTDASVELGSEEESGEGDRQSSADV